ncbi:unnamed protein product [Chrysoparadoxa australica]
MNMSASQRIAASADLYASGAFKAETSMDKRLHDILRELAVAKNTRKKYMDSTLLHATPQRFPTEIYLVELENEIVAMLREQVLERERALKRKGEVRNVEVPRPAVSDSSDDDAENWETGTRLEKVTGKSMGRSQSANQKERAAALVMGPPRPVPSAPDDDTGWHGLPVVKKLTDADFSEEHDGTGGERCLACMTQPCQWSSCVDADGINVRKDILREEIFRLQAMKEEMCDTLVPLSCVRGGATHVNRKEAIKELRWESKELDRHIQMAEMDKELHDSIATTKDAVEVHTLHHYKTLMWKKDAVIALQAEREQQICKLVVVEVLDDLLEGMLEAWEFGQRVSEFAVAGFVPSFKDNGPLRPGDQRRAQPFLAHRYKRRAANRAAGRIMPQEVQGTVYEKSLPMEGSAQTRVRKEQKARSAMSQEHLLETTETSLKFAVLTMTISYLQVMQKVRRERLSWGVIGEARGDSTAKSTYKLPRTKERKQMVAQDNKTRERIAGHRRYMAMAKAAEDRAILKQQSEKRERARRRAALVRLQRAQTKCAVLIQSSFRGMRGKRLAKRWALKRAEIEALKAVLHEAATHIQRVFRGHLGRVEAAEVRMELAEFIVKLRVEEAEADVKEYWDTHRAARLSKTVSAKIKKVLPSTMPVMPTWRRRKAEANKAATT